LDPARARQTFGPLITQYARSERICTGTCEEIITSLEAGDDIWWVYIVARFKRGLRSDRRKPLQTLSSYDVLDKTKEFSRRKHAHATGHKRGRKASADMSDDFPRRYDSDERRRYGFVVA